MAKSSDTIPATQRAYTLRLQAANTKQDGPEVVRRRADELQSALWATHEAVNKGAKVFGDWLLTLRGGLDHRLADEGPVAERKNRRILLALSWLSVEDVHGAPQNESLIVAKGTDSTDSRARKLEDALATVLRNRGVGDSDMGDPKKRHEEQPGTWLGDCVPSLSAAIREDAVWVNRDATFDSFTLRRGAIPNRAYVASTVLGFLELKGPYFSLPAVDGDGDGLTFKRAEEEKPFVNEATGWLCDNWGSGVKSDKSGISIKLTAFVNLDLSGFAGKRGTELLREFCRVADVDVPDPQDQSAMIKGLCKFVGWRGRKSAGRMAIELASVQSVLTQDSIQNLCAKLRKESADKLAESEVKVPTWMPAERSSLELLIGMPYRINNKDNTFEFAVMLDHALRKVSGVHSWIKNAEAERRQFESDAERIINIPAEALDWLRRYCEERAVTSGSIDQYRIRKRAIDGWVRIVDCWSRSDCETAEDRIAIARQMQDDPEIDKFGDIQLFEALADDDACCVWKPNGVPTAEPLKDFVAAEDAEAKKRRFKVPAYRHPDALRHPVFTDFGNSRWHIDFSAHRAPTKLEGLSKKVAKLSDDLADAEKGLEAAAEAQLDRRRGKVEEIRSMLKGAEQKLTAMLDCRRLELKLWNRNAVEAISLRWSCKRLASNLALNMVASEQVENATQVARADRLGRAANGANGLEGVTIASLFEQAHWNGRLQAPRAQLDAIARQVAQHGWDAKSSAMVQRIRWLVSFSAELVPNGPWVDFAAAHGLKTNPTYWPHVEANKKRQGHSRLLLSRLPGLRILAVDLGHRFSAACSVWEAISKVQIEQACAAAAIRAPSAEQMYVYLRGTNAHGKATVTVHRRIGSDTLPDGAFHPAPWARLDRQFLIKLQGEDRKARKSSPTEVTAVEQFERWAGLTRSAIERRRALAVDMLMSDAVRTARLALARHGRRARISNNMTATTRILPGARTEPLDDAIRTELLTDTLSDWHSLAVDGRWDDEAARQIWNERLANLSGGFAVERQLDHPEADAPTRLQRRDTEDALRKRLSTLVSSLTNDPTLCKSLHDVWAARWQVDDDRWRKNLKWLSRWLMPRGGARGAPSRRRVGGISLTRIATLTEFRRKVQVGFFTRAKPDGSKASIGQNFGRSTLDAIERLKDNRIKQLASRITEAALGVGIERRGAHGRDLKRPRSRLEGSRFAPCHAVVIEDLAHYRPEETRTRRENRATMDWKSAEARKRLTDHCQLYGLHLRDVNPQYTSRQDSRTGAPGVRCVDVPVIDFLTKTWWRKQVTQAKKKARENKGDARDRFLLALEEKWCKAADGEKQRARPLRIPLKGGDLFVSADENSPSSAGIQADINAAANIGLRALMDPDFPGKWWYVPCEPHGRQPKLEKVKGGILDKVGSLQAVQSAAAVDKPKRKRSSPKTAAPKEVVNLWRDPQAMPIHGLAGNEVWHETPAYWKMAQFRVIGLLRKKAGLMPE